MILMTWWQAIILGALQGLTEFLPVSSSGHLVLAQHVLGLDLTQDVTFEVFLHAGTALSIVTVYRHRLSGIIGDMIRTLTNPTKAYPNSHNVRIAWQVVCASIPAGLAYVFLDTELEWTYEHPWFSCTMLIATGLLLGSTFWVPAQSGEVTLWKSLWIGAAQAVSLLPGMSRSGATISTGLLAGIQPDSAADFSFIMVLPLIFGATLIKGWQVLDSPEAVTWLPLLIGMLTAYGTGIFAIHMVLGFVRRGRLHTFAFYCVALGGLGLFLLR